MFEMQESIFISPIFEILLYKHAYQYDLKSATIKASDKSCTISVLMYLIRLVDKFYNTGARKDFLIDLLAILRP